MTRKLTKNKSGIELNINTLIGGVVTILAGVILWVLTNALGTAKENQKTLTKIDTVIPYVQEGVKDVKQSVGEVKQDVSNMKSTMVTRDEMNNKQTRTEAALKEVKDEQTRVKDELTIQRKKQ